CIQVINFPDALVSILIFLDPSLSLNPLSLLIPLHILLHAMLHPLLGHPISLSNVKYL
ncbi:hypothetical protein HMI55_000867, partial [Coelomomyces lativittatus]